MITDYNARKKEVLDSCARVEKLVDEFVGVAEKAKLPDQIPQIQTLLTDIRGKAERVRANRFSLMVAGESKSGKSTFINAYLGVELLPMDVKQCTSSIVVIKYGERFKLKATYANDRIEEIKDEEAVRKFLKENAALDDDYRDIPVPTINNEILVKSGKRAKSKNMAIKISEDDVKNLLAAEDVKAANIYHIPDYDEKIRRYINTKKNFWSDIVTKIEIFYPFAEELRGIEIVDSPGVCAHGGVGGITSDYIEKADAIIFLKPISGQALESVQFNEFMKNTSVERNRNALFLVLTHAANLTPADLERLKKEALRQFKNMNESNIIVVDSKAELYAKKFSAIPDIESQIRDLNSKGVLDDFVKGSWFDSGGDTKSFITELRKKSQFSKIEYSLQTFGRTAHYILLSALLDSICKLYTRLWNDVKLQMDMFRQKAEDPVELSKKISYIKNELDTINNKMYKGVDEITNRFLGDEGIIKQTADSEEKDFEEQVDGISVDDDNCFNELERVSFHKIDKFKEVTETLQKNVIAECDKALVALSEKETIPYDSLKPDFTEATFHEVRDSTESKAYETHSYEEGITFKETRKYSEYSRKKHFGLIKANIMNRLNTIKNDLVTNVNEFVTKLGKRYIDELKNNADAMKRDLDAIMEAKVNAEQIAIIIKDMEQLNEKISSAKSEDKKIKGGIEKNVQ